VDWSLVDSVNREEENEDQLEELFGLEGPSRSQISTTQPAKSQATSGDTKSPDPTLPSPNGGETNKASSREEKMPKRKSESPQDQRDAVDETDSGTPDTNCTTGGRGDGSPLAHPENLKKNLPSTKPSPQSPRSTLVGEGIGARSWESRGNQHGTSLKGIVADTSFHRDVGADSKRPVDDAERDAGGSITVKGENHGEEEEVAQGLKLSSVSFIRKEAKGEYNDSLKTESNHCLRDEHERDNGLGKNLKGNPEDRAAPTPESSRLNKSFLTSLRSQTKTPTPRHQIANPLEVKEEIAELSRRLDYFFTPRGPHMKDSRKEVATSPRILQSYSTRALVNNDTCKSSLLSGVLRVARGLDARADNEVDGILPLPIPTPVKVLGSARASALPQQPLSQIERCRQNLRELIHLDRALRRAER